MAAGGVHPEEGTPVEFGGEIDHDANQNYHMTDSGPALRETEVAACGNRPDEDGRRGEIDFDAMVVTDQCYNAPQLQRWIFQELSRYRASCDAKTEYVGLDVFPTNLRYSENKARLLETSNPGELGRKAYIIKRNGSKAISDSSEPSRADFTTHKKIQLLLNSGDEQATLAYLGGCWQQIGKRKRKDEQDDRDRNLNPDMIKVLNPDMIKVWAFFRLTNEVRDKVRKGNFSLEDLGDPLCIVLPAEYTPVTLKRALRTLLSKDIVERLKQAAQVLAVTDGNFSQLTVMLENLHDNEWADWVWDPTFVGPSLAELAEFAYKHRHMPGVQSAAEIAQGDFNAPQHFKAMLMYQEMFLQFLDQHAREIASLGSRIEMLRARDEAKFRGVPSWASEKEQVMLEYQVSQ
jgi:hypothetical protein